MMYLFHKFPIYNKFMFFHPRGESKQSFNFSSDINKIGVEWDVSIQNGTYVDVISDPVEIDSVKYGKMTLLKIKADVATDYHTIIKEFWVPYFCVVKVDDNETSSIELRN